MSGRRRDLCLAGDDERLGDQRADDAGLTRAGDVDPFERRIVPDVVRRVAVRDLPEDFALVEADRADAPVRRLHDRQALDVEATATALTAASTTTAGCATAAAPCRRIRAALRGIRARRD